MTHEEREIRSKKRTLEHANRSGTMRRTCRYFGMPRSLFYLWRNAFRERGDEGLLRRKRAPGRRWNQTPDEVVKEGSRRPPDLPPRPEADILVPGALPRHERVGRHGVPRQPTPRPEPLAEARGTARVDGAGTGGRSWGSVETLAPARHRQGRRHSPWMWSAVRSREARDLAIGPLHPLRSSEVNASPLDAHSSSQNRALVRPHSVGDVPVAVEKVVTLAG